MSAAPAPFESAHGALALRDPAEPPDRLAEERQEERINAPRLAKYLNKTLDAIAELDQNENLKIHNEMVKAVAYYDGRTDGYLRNGEWVDNSPVDGEILDKDNEVKRQVDKLQMEMCRGRIEYHPEASNKFNAEMREAAQFAERRVKVNQDRIETEPFIQGENMSLLLKTWALRYTFFDQNADSQEQAVETRVMKHVTAGSKIQVCRTCELSKTEPVCPKCGDTESKELGYGDSEGIKTEQKKKPAGRVVTVRPDATMVQLDLNGRDVQSSLFVRWRIVLRRCDWESMFPSVKIPSSDESTEGRHRAESQNHPPNSVAFGTADGNTGGGGDQFEKIEGELVWLDPKVYQRYVNKETETLGKDRQLPANTKFIEQYPAGACVARIGKTILDIFPSNKNECWTMCVYGLREHALHGSGIASLLALQDTMGELNSCIRANIYYRSMGREFVRSGAIEGGQLPPYNKVGIINGGPETGNVVDWAYGSTRPESLSGDVYAFRESTRGSIQDAAGTSSLSMQGAADVKALGTATGVEASRDQAVGRMIPNRKLQAYMGVEWIKQVLCLEREHYTPEMFLETAGRCDEKGEVEYTERGVRAFFDCDVKNDLIVKPVDGSWMPTTPQQDRANATSFAQAAAQLKDSPELVSLIAPKFDIDHSIDEWGAAQRNASMRLEEYARICGVITKGGHPPSPEIVQVVLSNIPEWARPDDQMDDHDAFMDFFDDWWLSDEGRNADPLLRLVIKEIHSLHVGGKIAQAKVEKAGTDAVLPPPTPPLSRVAESITFKDAPLSVQKQIVQQAGMDASGMDTEAQPNAHDAGAEAAIGAHALGLQDREHQAAIDVAKREHEAQIQANLKEHEAGIQADLESHKAMLSAAATPPPQAKAGQGQ